MSAERAGPDGSESRGTANGWMTALLVVAATSALGFLFVSRGIVIGAALGRLSVSLLAGGLTTLASLGWTAMLRSALARGMPSTGLSGLPSAGRDIVLGLPLFGTACFLTGLMSTHPLALSVPLTLGAFGGLLELRRLFRARSPRCPGSRPPSSVFTLISVGLVACCVGIAAAMALLPPSNLDELAYHLSVPQQWVIEGRVVSLPLNSQSFFPFGVESGSLPMLALLGPTTGAVAAHITHVLVAAAVLVVAYDFVARRASNQAAWVAVAALTTTPALLWTTGLVFTEWTLIGVCLVLLDGLAGATESDDAGERRWLPDVALALGAGIATKYTFGLIALTLVVAFAIATRGRRASLRELAPFGIAGFALGSAFFLRNLLTSGNPVAPFGDPIAPRVAFFGDGANVPEVVASYTYSTSMVEESLGVSLAAAAIGLAVSWRRLEAPFLKAAALGLILTFAALVALRPVGRILLPALSSLALLGIIAADDPARRAARSRAVTHGALLLAAGAQTLLLASLYAQFDPLAATATPERERAYLSAERGSHAVTRWMDAQLPAGSKTLVVGLHEMYWFTHRVRGAGNLDGPRMTAFLDAESPEALHSRLLAAGFDHIAIYRNHLVVSETPTSGALHAERTTTLSPSQAAMFRAYLDRKTALAAATEVAAVHRLLGADEPGR